MKAFFFSQGDSWLKRYGRGVSFDPISPCLQGSSEIWSGRAFANLLSCVQKRIKTGTVEEDGSYVGQGRGKAALGEEIKSLACFA